MFSSGPGNIFDGNDSIATILDDNRQRTTVLDYLAANPTVRAVADRDSGYVYLDDSFHRQDRIGMSAVIYYFGRRSVAVFLPLLITTVFQVTGQGQVIGPRQDEVSVLVKTWKTGNAKIAERTFSLNLGEEMREYEVEISDQTKRRHFRLQLRRMHFSTIRRPSINCWWVGLKEVTKDRKTGGNILGADLLSIEGPGVGDSFAREDWAGVLCPVEKPQKVLDGALYGITVERNFLIEKFLLSIQVKDFKYDEAEVRLKSMDLLITFKNQ